MLVESLTLAPVHHTDGDRLHRLFCLPYVYRYLADGVPPAREITTQWIVKSQVDRTLTQEVGLYLLIDTHRQIVGCVRTHFLDAPRTAELTYMLHPDLRGRGLATAMGWTALQRAFDSGLVDTVVAGTDDPNTASIAVMKRLGMRFRRRTRNPRWMGVEYVRLRGDPPPDPVPGTLPVSD